MSYNGVTGNRAAAASTGDDSNDYFMSDDTASRVMRKDEVKLPCRCEPGGCPMCKFFLLSHRFLSQPAPQP